MKTLVGVAAFAAITAASEAGHAVTTVTTYLPFEQHNCANFYVLGQEQGIPAEACEAGSCCLGVEGGSSGVVLINDDNVMEGDDSWQEGEGGCRGGCTGACHGDCHGGCDGGCRSGNHGGHESTEGFITRRLTETIRRNVTGSATTVITTQVTSGEVEVFTTTRTTNSVITTETDVVVTTTTTNSDGEATTETITTESPVVITTPVTTTEVVTTTEEVVTDKVITTEVPDIKEEEEVIVEDVLIPPVLDPELEPNPIDEDDPTCPVPKCQAGVEMALYSNPFRSDFSNTYKTFDPNYFKKTKPVETEVTTGPIFISDQRVNGRFNPKYSNAAAGYRGFMFACQDGVYRFESPYSDDITIMWFGDKAYSGYTRENADIIQFYYGNNKRMSVTREIKAGTYYPIRVLWGNTGGASDLSLRIYAPDGRELSGIDETNQNYITTRACDGSYEPYAPWGDEP